MPVPHHVGTFLDVHTMIFTRRFSMNVQQLWPVLTRKSDLDQWFMPTEIELRAQGRYTFDQGWKGWIDDLQPQRQIQFNERNGNFTRFEIQPDGTGSSFALIHHLAHDATPPAIADGPALYHHQPGGPGTHWTGLAAGWHCFVGSLHDYMKGERERESYHTMCLHYDYYLVAYWAQHRTPS